MVANTIWPVLALTLALGGGRDDPTPAQPVVPLNSLFSDNDYPVDALARGAEGIVAVRLVISAAGAPAECKIAESSGDASLDATTCAILMQRSRFLPARNANGRPVIDSVMTRIRWRLAGRLPRGVAPFTAHRLAIGIGRSSDGEIQCRGDVNGVRQPLPLGCPDIGPVLTAIVERLRPGMDIAIVRSFIPDGGIIATPAIAYGELLAEAEAEIMVDANGGVATCRSLYRTVHVAGSPTLPDLCDPNALPRFEPGQPGRRARIKLSLYLGAVATS